MDDEFNGVVIKGLYYDKQFMFGRGAGGHPTGSAILSDITACLYDYRYEYKKRKPSVWAMPEFTDDVTFRIYCRYSSPHDLSRDTVRQDFGELYLLTGSIMWLAKRHCMRCILLPMNCASEGIFVAAYPEINRGLCHGNRSCVPMMEIFSGNISRRSDVWYEEKYAHIS